MEKSENDNKNAIVTGSGGGIGSRVARDLSEKGYRVILVDINKEANEKLASELPNSESVILDLTDREALADFCSKIPEYKPEIAFVNAGMIHPGDITDTPSRMIDLQLEINLYSAIMINKACAIYMKAQQKGNIVNTVSLGGVVGLKSSSIYSATKFGLRGFIMAIHSELRPYNVYVSGIYPGAVDTQMLRYEAENGGSVLNFMNKISSVDDVLKGVNKAIKTGQLEVYVPHSDSYGSKILGGLMPGKLHNLYPFLERQGFKGKQKYLDRLKNLIASRNLKPI